MCYLLPENDKIFYKSTTQSFRLEYFTKFSRSTSDPRTLLSSFAKSSSPTGASSSTLNCAGGGSLLTPFLWLKRHIQNLKTDDRYGVVPIVSWVQHLLSFSWSHSATLSLILLLPTLFLVKTRDKAAWEAIPYLLNQFMFLILIFGITLASGMNALNINIWFLMSYTLVRIKAKGEVWEISLDIKFYHSWFLLSTFF